MLVASQNKHKQRFLLRKAESNWSRRFFFTPWEHAILMNVYLLPGRRPFSLYVNFSWNADRNGWLVTWFSQRRVLSGGDFSWRSLARACVNLISARRRGRPFFARSFVAAPSTACNLSNAFGLVNNAHSHTHTRATPKQRQKRLRASDTLLRGGGSGGAAAPANFQLKPRMRN